VTAAHVRRTSGNFRAGKTRKRVKGLRVRELIQPQPGVRCVSVNLDPYFDRIGWRGSRAATPDVLAGLVAHHVQAIPFENLDVLLGNRPQLDLGSLERKLVEARRGGYCYEHSTLFAAVLTELGFAVKTHSARVVMVAPRSAAPRTHMFSSLEHDIPIDFEMANHFTATHPASHFTQGVMMRAYTAEGQVRIRNRDVTLIRGGETQTFQLADRKQLRETVATHFGFDLPAIETMHVPAIPEWH
jgi:arylamine N-acetyltransferase